MKILCEWKEGSPVPINIWLTRKLSAQKLSVSEDSIDRRGIPYQAQHVPGKLRYKVLELEPGKTEGRRYIDADLDAMMYTPPALERPNRRKLFMREG